jgi:RNA polymerase sigma factor (sigma-70 family)
MVPHPLQDFIRRLRRTRSVTEGGHLTDGQLLERFIRQRDEAAFEVLVWRHGTLVLNVALRMLRNSSDVEDVFQATFLTLARKASAIRRDSSVSSWLYKVTYRIALRLRQSAPYRKCQEQRGLDNVTAPAESSDADLGILLAEEVNRLPERYRAVVALCYLQGVTTEEAARVLGCPRGTVLSRLSSARQRLRQRLVSRGIAPAIALVAVSFGEAASATPSVALVACVVRAALPFAAGRAAVPMVSSQAAALAQGALQTMLWNKIGIGALTVCMIALVGTGSGWLARGRSEAEAYPPVSEPPSSNNATLVPAAKQVDDTRKEIETIQKVLAILLDKQQAEEKNLSDAVIEARLELLELKEDLKWHEDLFGLDRERLRDKIQARRSQIKHLEGFLREYAEKSPDGKANLAQERIKKNKKEHEEELVALEHEERRDFVQLREKKREMRRAVIQAEVKLENVEIRQSRQREDFASQRERLQRHLQQLEDKSLKAEPADRVRDVERKLDALRREIGELRRALERQGNDPRKKP